MGRASTFLTKYPNGVAQFTGYAIGGAAGALTVVGGIAVGDRILQANFITLSGVLLKSCVDLTSEFSITGSNAVTNVGGTATSAGYVQFTFAKGADNA